MTKASDNVFPKVELAEGAAPGTPSAAQVRLYAKSDGLVYSKDDAGAETLVSGGSGLSTGTSFPGGPSTGARYRRSDIDYMIFLYDGTRWVSEQMFTMTGSTRALVDGAALPGSPGRFSQTPIHHTLSIWAVRLDADWYVATTNSGSHYWTLDIKNVAESTTHVTVNTSAMSANTWTSQVWTTGGVIPASDLGLMWILTKTGTPGSVTVAPSLVYRLIAT